MAIERYPRLLSTYHSRAPIFVLILGFDESYRTGKNLRAEAVATMAT